MRVVVHTLMLILANVQILLRKVHQQFIGDSGSTSLATPAIAPEIDLDPVTTVRTATGVSSNINVTPEKAREVIRGRSVELENGIDPDLNEPFESGSSTTPAPLPSAKS